ncbi:MAG TPA: lactate racemase domain-containing protein [Planctomycetota bacterium]|nr:lactate racemase domain-containing protein [Planctomycetota bacterium]
MRIELKYGSGRVGLDVPDRNLEGFVSLAGRPEPAKSGEAFLAEAEAALRRDGGFARAVGGKTVALLVDDATREEPREQILPLVSRALEKAKRVLVFVCTGTHDPSTADQKDLAALLGRLLEGCPLRGRSEVIVNDARAGDLVEKGRTRRGVRVLVNRRAEEAEAFLAVSDMKNHYFAGYSSPVKNFVPGIAGLETARGNHAMALDPLSTFGRHPLHPDPRRRDNPLADDLWEGTRLLLAGRPAYALTLFTHAGRVRFASAGPIERACAAGIEAVDREAGVTVAPADVLVVSPGGHPHDESLYTAQRALELTKWAAKDGGEILFLAECRNGIGPPEAIENFYGALASPLPEVLESLRSGYRMYAHKSYKFAELLLRVSAVHMVSSLPPETLARIHLRPAADPQAALAECLRRRPAARVLAFDDASKFAVHVAESAGIPS